MNNTTSTDRIFLTDSYCREFDATVLAVDSEDTVALDVTAFYATGGGQPCDTGILKWDGGTAQVIDVRGHDIVWHTLEGDTPAAGTRVHGEVNWEHRYALMRTHTALHILCGVIHNEWGVPVTGGNMSELSARMDFDFGPLPEGFAARVTELVNTEIAADRPIEVSFWPRAEALTDADLIRTKVNLVPESVKEIRVVDIVGLDRQADGGTHVSSTAEVGRFEITKTKSKGKSNKRIWIAVHDS